MSRHNGLHKTGPGPSIWHGHVQGCRGLRQRRSGPFKVSSRAALFSMHLKSGQYSHLTAICASRHYFFSFGRIAYVLSIHFLAPVSLASKAGLPVEDGGEALRRRKSAECVFIRTECSIQNGWNTRCCAQVMEERPATCTPHNTSKQCTAAWCRTAALCTQIFLLPTNVSTNMMTEEERGGEILHYCCGDASIITGT